MPRKVRKYVVQGLMIGALVCFLLYGLVVLSASGAVDRAVARLSKPATTGPTSSTPGTTTPPTEEDAVRKSYETFLVALKARDADTLWDLLCKDGRNDAEEEARKEVAIYNKSNPRMRAAQAKELGVTVAEVGALTGKTYLKTGYFLETWGDTARKIEQVAVKGDEAKIVLLDSDGDKTTLLIVREQGQWKILVRIIGRMG